MAVQQLYVDSVSHHYGGRSVLSGVYLTCHTGEVLGLLGRNGCGKSTLLKIIFGALRPHYIHLKLNDELLNRAYLSKKIAYLPQGFFIPQYLKVGKLVQLYIKNYTDRILNIPVIRDNLNQPIGHLSGGQRRLVEALLILYSDAPFVLLDEPFSQLAPLVADELKMHIEALKAEKGFIVTDHYYRQILAVSDRIVLLHNGSNYTINSEEDLIQYGYLPALV